LPLTVFASNLHTVNRVKKMHEDLTA